MGVFWEREREREREREGVAFGHSKNATLVA